MKYTFSRWFKVVCCMLIAALVIGMLPWRELSADANTHGKYTAKPFEITYEQNSTWGKSTQGQFVVKNTSTNTVKSWILEIDYAGDVRVSNITNFTNVDFGENLVYLRTAMHRRLHTTAYHRYVYSMLDAEYIEGASEQVNMHKIAAVLYFIGKQLQSMQDAYPQILTGKG